MKRSIFIGDSFPVPEGHGGGVVSYHEIKSLATVFPSPEVYTRPKETPLLVDVTYPGNPYMFDYCIAAAIKNPETVTLAKIYGAGLPLTMKSLHGAKVIPTVPVHNLKISVEEWWNLHNDASCYGAGIRFKEPEPHVTNEQLFRLIMLGIRKYATTIVCPGTNSVNFLKDYFKDAPPKGEIVIIPHGTDIPEKVATKETRGDIFTVLHVGSVGSDKGDRYLQHAWASAFPHLKNARLVFMGNNASWFGIGFKSSGLGDFGSLNVSCLSGPAANAAAKENAYFGASVYVQSSVTEGWGIPVGEAMAHGIPAIVTDRTGAVDMITDGSDGFIVPIRDPAAIAEKIRYFYDNPIEVIRMGANARHKAWAYSWERVEKMYADLIRRESE